MGAIHEHFRLHDWDEISLLAQRGVTREAMGIGTDTERRRDITLVDLDHGAPFGEPRAQLLVLGEPFAQAVQALGNLVARVLFKRKAAFEITR